MIMLNKQEYFKSKIGSLLVEMQDFIDGSKELCETAGCSQYNRYFTYAAAGLCDALVALNKIY